MAEDSVENQISSLCKEGKWQEIIDLGKNLENHEEHRILWVWPSMEDLNWIHGVIREYKLQGIISIGCGTGLLEWIIQQYTSCEVVGVEMDRAWWQSKYSPPMYLKSVIFIDEDRSNIAIPPSYGILFCYFNNGVAFCDYMKNYPGAIVIVIGPDEGQNRCTNPLPFDSKFSGLGWRLCEARKLNNNKDILTLYVRLRSLKCNKQIKSQ